MKEDKSMDDIVIVMPSYKPNEEIMLDFVKDVKKHFTKIVVIDDGSGEKYNQFFEELQKQEIIVLKHHINLGKGRGIKTAFNYILNEYDGILGAITADCDGQHCIEDIIKCADALRKNLDKLIIGCRNFDEKQVPFRSRFGNKITRNIFGMFVGIKITDTQSGLRAFGTETIKKCLDIPGERYEYETNMLIECKNRDIKIEEVTISTIYLNNNSLSHFNPIKDSIIIYKVFIKYIISSLSSFMLDILLFAVFVRIIPEITLGVITNIVIATIIARIISSIYNFLINSKVVFKNKNKKSIIRYFVLVILQMFISAFCVSELFKLLNIDSTLLKVIVDTIIFLINFVVQREWVFKK